MNRSASLGALLLAASLSATPITFAQDGVPTLTTDDVRSDPSSVTRSNEPDPDDDATEGAEAAESAAPSRGYVRVTTPSGYRFERPAGWEPIENLVSNGAPSYFKYDAIFQDPKTGAVLSAISVDRSQIDSPLDIGDEASINQLLATMLNPANAKSGVKIFRQIRGDTANGARWLRIKAQGTGQAEDGSIVDTHFWVQIVQTDTRFALVAVGYPAQQESAAQAAYHAVRTLEIEHVGGDKPAPPKRDDS
jgi:hypothetical protein